MMIWLILEETFDPKMPYRIKTYWNCYKKMDSELSQIMQPVLVVGLNNLAFPSVCGSPA